MTWKLSNGIEWSFVLERGASAVETVKQDLNMIPAVRPRATSEVRNDAIV